MPTYEQISTLTEFFEEYGPTLAAKAERKLRPLHVPGTDPISFDWNHKFPKGEFRRLLYEPQAHVVEASRKCLDHQNQVWIIGEIGTGKTAMGTCTAHVHARGRPYRSLVVCPDHLLDKWVREIEACVPNALVQRVRHWREFLDMVPDTVPFKFNLWPDPVGPEWVVIGRDKVKLGPAWGLAAWPKLTSLTVPKYILRCPQCGATILDTKGDPLRWSAMPKSRRRLRCKGTVLKLTGSGDEAPEFVETECGSTLWQYSREGVYRWAPERVINTHLRGYFDYLILDEVHEYKGESTAQANAAGAIAAVAKNVIAMTGTLIGGYASHIFPLTFRLIPRSLIEDGFMWGESMEFCRRYGKVERTERINRKTGNEVSNRSSRGESSKRDEKPAPGILPSLYGRHVMGHTVFLGLAELAKNLPKLDEDVLPSNPDDELAEAIQDVNEKLVPVACEMAAKGDMRLLGTMLEVLLYYPDHPYGWGTVGFTDKETNLFIPVMEPKELDPRVVRPKEEAFVKFVGEHRNLGNQVWAYVQRTGERDALARLEWLVGREGMNATVLRSSVNREKREGWIAEQGRWPDCMISHPQLVETGLDLFSNEPDGHNYNTICFFQTGYRTFTMMQASRRAWRLGQRKNCVVRYFYYHGTAQDGALSLMGHKLKATLALQGQYSEEGLAAMTGDDQDALSMAKMLTQQVHDTGRVWKMVANQMGTDQAVQINGHEHKAEEKPYTGIEITDEMRDAFFRGVGHVLKPCVPYDPTELIREKHADKKKRKGKKP